MPYALIAMLAAMVLGVRYVTLSDASLRSKVVVGAVVAASLVIWLSYPQWMIVAVLLQVAVSLFVLLYLELNPHASLRRIRRPVSRIFCGSELYDRKHGPG